MKLTRSDVIVLSIFFLFLCGGAYYLYDYYSRLGYGSDTTMMPFDEKTFSRLQNIVLNSPVEHNIPNRECYRISQNVKQTDSPEKITASVQNAINECSLGGGGRIVIDRGSWIVQSLLLKNHIDFSIEEGSEILFDENILSYPTSVPYRFEGIRTNMSQPLLYAFECEDVKISGKGSIRGNEKAWLKYAESEKYWFEFLYQESEEREKVENRTQYSLKDTMAFRPDMIGFSFCSNISVEGVALENSPRNSIRALFSNKMLFQDLTIKVNSLDGDAVVLDSSSNILYSGGKIQSEKGDGIVFQSGLDAEGRAMDENPLQNIRIQNVDILQSRNAIDIDRAMSGGMNRIVTKDIHIYETVNGIATSLPSGIGGSLRHFLFQNIKMDTVFENAIFMDLSSSEDDMRLRSKEAKKEDVRLRDIFFVNVQAYSKNNAMTLKNFYPKNGNVLRNSFFYFKNIDVASPNGSFFQGLHQSLFEGILSKGIGVDNENPSLKIMDSLNIFFSTLDCEKEVSKDCLEFSGTNQRILFSDPVLKENVMLYPRIINKEEKTSKQEGIIEEDPDQEVD